VPALFAAVLATGCGLLEEEVWQPAPSAPLDLFVGVDNSWTYGVDSARVRRAAAPDAFAASKRRLFDVLASVLAHGDEIVGIVPFTDERVPELGNRIPSGRMQIDSTRKADLHAELNMVLDGIQLRPPTERYATVYGQVLDAALVRFGELGTPPEQRLILVLTDEIGSEAVQGSEVPPEAFRQAYVLVFRAAPSGELSLTPNARLTELVPVGGVGAEAYIEAVRTAYREGHPVRVMEKRFDRMAFIAVLLLLATAGAGLHFVRRRRAARAPRLDGAFFSPQAGAVVVSATNLDLPTTPVDYLVDGGATPVTEVRRLDGRVHLVLGEELPPGPHRLVVQAPTGPFSAVFSVQPRPRQEAYQLSVARVTDLANPRSMPLDGQEVEVLDGFPGIKTSLRAKREGSDLVLRTRRGRARAEDGTEILGRRTVDLGEAMSRAIIMDLEDDRETIELTVRRVT
jgi:hypothetical protein